MMELKTTNITAPQALGNQPKNNVCGSGC